MCTYIIYIFESLIIDIYKEQDNKNVINKIIIKKSRIRYMPGN